MPNPWCVELDGEPVLDASDPSFVTPDAQVRTVVDILLVEDDAMVRECLSELLADVGCWVSGVANATEALDHMAMNGVPDVLVTDLVLGCGMSGLMLIAAARLRWPEVRAVLISGTDIVEPALDLGDRFLRKPFEFGTLACAVAELAAGQASNMLSPDDTLKDGPDVTTKEPTVQVVVNGTTFMADYVVEDAAVLLTSANFGNASAALEGLMPADVAAQLLRGMANAAMACASCAMTGSILPAGEERFTPPDRIRLMFVVE